MSKKVFSFVFALIIVSLCCQVVFGDDPQQNITSTQTLGGSADSLTIEFSSGGTSYGINISNAAVLTINGTANNEFSLSFANSGNTSSYLYGINFSGTNIGFITTDAIFNINGGNVIKGNTTNHGALINIASGNNTITTGGTLNLTYDGDYVDGISSVGTSVLALNSDLTIDSTGSYSVGIYASNTQTTIYQERIKIVGDVSITGHGNDFKGLSLNSSIITILPSPGRLIAALAIEGKLDILLDGSSTGYGIYAKGAQGSGSVNYKFLSVEGDTTIETVTDDSHAIYIERGRASFGLIDEMLDSANSKFSFVDEDAIQLTTIITHGNNAYGIHSNNAQLAFAKLHITTYGESAHGMNIITTINQSSTKTEFFGIANITTNGANAIGVNAESGASVYFHNVTNITTTGKESHGLVIGANYGSSSHVRFNEHVSIRTTGADSVGIMLNNWSYLHFVKSADIHSEGPAMVIQRGSSYASDDLRLLGHYLESVVLSSESGVAIYNGYEATYDSGVDFMAELYFFGESKIYGNIENRDPLGVIYIELQGNSFLRGGVVGGLTSHFGVRLGLIGQSYWLIGGDYEVDVLSMGWNSNDASVVFEYTDTFYTATIRNMYIGNNGRFGTFKMNVNMKTGEANKVVVTNLARGDYFVEIMDQTPSGEAAVDKVLILDAADIFSGRTLELQLKDFPIINLGGRMYQLENENYLKWYLVRMGADNEIVDGVAVSIAGLFEIAKAIDAVFSDELVMPKRSVWAVLNYKRQNFSELGLDEDLSQNIFNLVAGADVLNEKNWAIDAMLGLTLANQDVNDMIKATTTAFTLGASAVYSKNEFYASGYLRVANYIHTFKVVGADHLVKGSLSLFGISASIQAMKKFYVSPEIFIAPKAKASYTQLFGGEEFLGLFEVISEPISGFVGWVGARFGVDTHINQYPFTVYAEAGYIYDTNAVITVYVDDYMKDFAIANSRYEIGIGFDACPNESSNITFEYKFAAGKNIIEPVKIKITGTTRF